MKIESAERARTLAEALCNPHYGIGKYIHVGGVLGKTSTIRFLSNLLSKCTNLRIGAFVHPVISSPQECILLNEDPISNAMYQEIAAKVETAATKVHLVPTQYEKYFIIAIMAFAQVHCDLIIVEAGLGGVFDASTILTSSRRLETANEQIAAIITKITVDFQEYLGNDIKSITENIMEIIRPETNVVVCHDQKEITDELVRRGIPQATETSLQVGPLVTKAEEMFIRLHSSGQWDNLELALKCFSQIQPILSHHFPHFQSRPPNKGIISDFIMAHTMVELYQGSIKFVLDAGQNAAADICKWIHGQVDSGMKNIHIVFGMQDKDHNVIKEFFTACGFSENVTYSLVEVTIPEGYPWIKALDRKECVKLFQSVHQKEKILRISPHTKLVDFLSNYDKRNTELVIITGSPHIVREFYLLTRM